jgi:hypothetical protein
MKGTEAMSTQTLTFTLPLSPKPSKSNASAVLHSSNGWTLTVRKTGSSRDINVSKKTVNITLTVSHYEAFCDAFKGSSGSKSAVITHVNSSVQSLKWDSTTVTLPDVGSLAPLAAIGALEGADDQQDSSRLV